MKSSALFSYMRYYLGYWRFDAKRRQFPLPAGARMALDLGILPLMAGGADRPGGLFVTPDDVTLGSDYTLLGSGDCREIKVDAKIKSVFHKAVGYEPHGDTLADLFWDCLVGGADPAGLSAPKPLMPTHGSNLELCLGYRLKEQDFVFGSHAHTNKVQAVLQNDFRIIWEALNAEADKLTLTNPAKAKTLRDHPLRVLDLSRKQLGLEGDDWKFLVPASLLPHVKGPLPHATTYTESFNGSDNDPLGPDLSWTADAGWTVQSSMANTTSGGDARADSNLSGVNHYAESDSYGSDSGGGFWGASVRYASTGSPNSITHYQGYYENQEIGDQYIKLSKVIAGSETILDTETGSGFPTTLRTKADGSSISVQTYGGGAQGPYTVTDTSISTGIRCGIYGQVRDTATYVQLDNFAATELFNTPPATYSATAISNTQIDLAWSAVTNATIYEYRQGNADPPTGGWTSNGSSTSVSLTGLTGTIKYFQVRTDGGTPTATFCSALDAYCRYVSNSGYKTTSNYRFNVTTLNGDNFLLVQISLLSVAGTAVNYVKFDPDGTNKSLTFVDSKASISGACRVETWKLIGSDLSVGTFPIEVDFNGTSLASAATGSLWVSIHQSTPLRNINSAQATNVGAANATVDITIGSNDSSISAVVASSDGSISPQSGNNERSNVTGAAGSHATGTQDDTQTAGSPFTSAWDDDALATWAIMGYELVPVFASFPPAAAVPGGTMLLMGV